eukprot:3913877-Amphidinium_carterae.1
MSRTKCYLCGVAIVMIFVATVFCVLGGTVVVGVTSLGIVLTASWSRWGALKFGSPDLCMVGNPSRQ